MQDLTLVIGGTGKTGRRVAERLQAQGRRVRVGSRSGQPPFDWEDRATWEPALHGAAAAYVSYYPDLTVPGGPEAIRSLAELAVATGTRRLVLLSGRGEAEAQRAEEAVQASGADWTIARCSWFMQNFSEGYLLDPLTFAEATQLIARACAREVALVPVPIEAYATAAAEEGVPTDVVAVLRYLFTEVLDGRNVQPSDGVQRALGRPARDFAHFARHAAASGVWSEA